MRRSLWSRLHRRGHPTETRRPEIPAQREELLDRREATVAAREELVRLREEAVRGLEQGARSSVHRERLLARLREANQALLLAGLRAERLSANAAEKHERLVLSEERFRRLVDATALIVWQADATGRIHMLSPPAWKALTGLKSHSIWLEAVPADEREEIERTWTEARLRGSEWTSEHRLTRRDGTCAWVTSHAVPIFHGDAEPQEWIGMIVDVTERHRVEEAREQFVSILGHDLRNPLHAIVLSASSLMRDPELPSEYRARAVRISVAALRMERMISDILDFARGRLGGGIPVVRAPLDLAAHFRHALEELRLSYPGREFQLEASGDLAGHWDPDRMEQVLSNLAGNAVQHGQDPIRVKLTGHGDTVRLEVHNRGAPIPAATLPHLFEPFRSGKRTGLGLGLYIVAEVVRAHGGSVGVRSTAEEGTTFTVVMPRGLSVHGEATSETRLPH